MKIVFDTNVLVSALWSPDSKPGKIITNVLSGIFTLCYDYRIITEYRTVLARPKFGFEPWQIEYLLGAIIDDGFSVIPEPSRDVAFVDESDRKFYDTAVYCHAPLVTGNIRHFPKESIVFTVTDFYNRYCL